MGSGRGNTMRKFMSAGRRGRFTVALLVTIGSLALASSAFATVWTDQADYSPGSVVTISGDNSNGAGYQAGETVDVWINGPNGWTSYCSGAAGDSGAWSCQFQLASDPAIAVGSYSYTAAGESSGVTETGTFTDKVATTLTATVTPNPATPSGSIEFDGTLTTAGSGQSIEVASYGTSSDCTGAHSSAATGTTTTGGAFAITGATAPASAGTYYYDVSFDGTSIYAKSDDCISLTVNSPAAADAGGPYSGDEGSDIQLSGSSSNTTGTVAYSWSATPDAGSEVGAACTFSDSTDPSATVNCNDEGSYTLTLSATDDNGTYQDTAALTVDNVAPVVDGNSLTATQSSTNACTVNFSGNFTDAGTLDTHTASIAWGDGNTSSSGDLSGAPTITEPSGLTPGSVSDSHTYSSGGSYTIGLTVTDEAGETGETGLTSDQQTVAFDNTPNVVYPLAPIQVGNGSKTYKVGSAIPIKVQVTGCTTGIGPVTVSISPTNGVVKAKGKSNTTTTMRYDSSIPGYIYNWNTTGWASTTYAVSVNLPPLGTFGPTNVTLK